MLQEFVRHRVTVIRRRTQFLLARARQRKHTVEGLLLAHANIDEVIRVIRASATQAEAKERLMQIETPAAMLQRALGDEGFASVRGGARRRARTTRSRPSRPTRSCEMTLGQLVNLEQEKLAGEHRKLLERDRRVPRASSPTSRTSLRIIREDCEELKRKHGDARRTEISGEEIGEIDLEDLIDRRDDGRLDHAQRLHQADAGQRLPRPAPRRQGPQGREDRGRRSDRAPLRRQHARLPAVLHQQGQGLLAEGLRPAAACAATAAAGRSSTC